MPQSLVKNYMHIVFSTKNRMPFLKDESLLKEAHSYIAGILNKLECTAIAVGGTADHVHILCALSKNRSLSDVIREIKKASSKWIKTVKNGSQNFMWQTGYGAFSVSQSQIKRVRSYILEQEKHHQNYSFQDEFRELLKKYEVDFDEKYVWD